MLKYKEFSSNSVGKKDKELKDLDSSIQRNKTELNIYDSVRNSASSKLPSASQ